MTYLDLLAALFAASGIFYAYRLLRPSHVRSTYGYWDWQNEVGHGLCMFAMVTMLSPALLPVSSVAWTWILGATAVFFTARALTWGKHVGYATKWWWDWAHVVMLGGMAAMYAGFAPIWLTVPLCAFWAWLFCYYWLELLPDLRSKKTLYIGSDIAHSAMGLVMLLMTLFPAAMMPAMGPMCHSDGMSGMQHSMPMHHDMPGMKMQDDMPMGHDMHMQHDMSDMRN